MQIKTNPALNNAHGWVFQLRRAPQKPARVLLLLHGWTGDESSMWSLVRDFLPNYEILAPRAPHPSDDEKGGYSWRILKSGTWGVPTFEELRLATDALVSLVDEWSASVSIDATRFDVIGFSQGGAMVTMLAALYPERIRKAGILAGFVPPGVDAHLRPNMLTHIPFFWAHGTEDKMIPLERARKSIEILEEAGAQVHLCQADVGHKVGKECRHALAIFFKD